MKWRQTITDYFSFNRRDRIAVLLLLALIITIFMVPKFIPSKTPIATVDTAWISAVKRLERPVKGQDPRSYPQYRPRELTSGRPNSYSNEPRSTAPRGALFEFDPNTLDSAGWRRLGIREKTTGIIRNFIARGGRFRNPTDLSKIYGLFPDEYARIEPYIRIAETNGEAKPQTRTREFAPTRPQPFDVNTADTSQFISLPGIGSKLAQRIIGFRDKLGGFYGIEQVGETYGLQDSVFQKIKPYLELHQPVTRKLDINTASHELLAAHPYVRFALAKAIVAYREEHGPFKSVEELLKIAAITPSILQRVVHYLVVVEK